VHTLLIIRNKAVTTAKGIKKKKKPKQNLTELYYQKVDESKNNGSLPTIMTRVFMA